MLRTLLAVSVSDNVEARQSRIQQFVGENTDELRPLHVPVCMCGMHVCVFMCCMCVCVSERVCACMHVYVRACVHVCVHACMHACVHACMCKCVCMHVHVNERVCVSMER